MLVGLEAEALTQGHQQGYAPSARSGRGGGGHPPLPLPASGGPGAPGLWLHHPVSASVRPWAHPLYLRLTFSVSYRHVSLALGPAWKIQDDLIPRAFITCSKTPLPNKVPVSVWGLGCGRVFCGAAIQPTPGVSLFPPASGSRCESPG